MGDWLCCGPRGGRACDAPAFNMVRLGGLLGGRSGARQAKSKPQVKQAATSSWGSLDPWPTGQEAVGVLTLHVVQLLGASRCAAMPAVCRSWRQEHRQVVNVLSHDARSQAAAAAETLRRSGDPIEASKSGGEHLLVVLSPGGPQRPSELDMEDDVYCLLAGARATGQVYDLLTCHTSIAGYWEVKALAAALKPHCKVSPGVVETLFRSQVERDRGSILPFWPRAVHIAVARPCVTNRLLSLLLAAAEEAGCLDEVLQRDSSAVGQRPSTLSPLFLAVLFADPGIVQVLRKRGCVPNEADVQAAARLQRAKLWHDTTSRMEELGLSEFAAEIAARLEARRCKIAAARAALKAAARQSQ